MNNLLHDFDNHYQIPSFEGSGALERLEQQKAALIEPKHLILDALDLYNIGKDTMILASSADGYGDFDPLGGLAMINQARKLSDNLGNMGIKQTTIVGDAKKSDLESVIRSKDVANILLLGHASFHSWVASDGAVDWFDLGNMVDNHLKNGVFGNLGCGAVHSWNFIPLGRYVIGKTGMLLGKSKEFATGKEMTDLSRYKVIK